MTTRRAQDKLDRLHAKLRTCLLRFLDYANKPDACQSPGEDLAEAYAEWIDAQDQLAKAKREAFKLVGGKR